MIVQLEWKIQRVATEVLQLQDLVNIVPMVSISQHQEHITALLFVRGIFQSVKALRGQYVKLENMPTFIVTLAYNVLQAHIHLHLRQVDAICQWDVVNLKF